jgi:hypothetical protein
MVRYADDFVVLAATEKAIVEARAVIADVLRRRGLAFNPAKTRVVRPGEVFGFLGHTLAASPVCSRGGHGAR